MRTSIQNLFATVLTLATLTTSAFAADGSAKNVTVLDQQKNINKIEVSGNVEVIVLQSPTQQVKVYDSYYSKNALVQEENGVLRISSFQKEQLTVAVYVSQLSAISGANQSIVRTQGKINFLDLSVTLADNAKAEIEVNTVSLHTIVKDKASVKLAGETLEYTASLSKDAKVNMGQFKAENSSFKAFNPAVAKVEVAKKKVNDLSELDELAK